MEQEKDEMHHTLHSIRGAAIIRLQELPSFNTAKKLEIYRYL